MPRAVYRTELQKILNGLVAPVANATCTIYEAGTVTPLAQTMYQGITGAPAFSNPLTADAEGTIQFFLDQPQAIKVVATGPGLGTVTADYQLVLTDQAGDLPSPSFTGQATFDDGSIGAPSIANIGDLNTGIHWPVGVDQIAIGGGAAGVVWRFDGQATPAGPRSYILDPLGTKAVLTLTRGDTSTGGSAPDTSYTGALMVTSFHTGTNQTRVSEAIKGAAIVLSGQGDYHLGVMGTAEASSAGDWNPAGNSALIGVFGQGTSNRTGGRTWGANFIAKGLIGDQSVMTVLELGMEAASPVQDRYGMQIVTLAAGVHSGTREDIAFKLADKRDPTVQGNLWAIGIGFGSQAMDSPMVSTGFPVKQTGTLIRSFGSASVANGIDFSGLTITGNLLRGPNNLYITGTGSIGIGVAGGPNRPLHINAGNSAIFRVDNPLTATAAAGGTGTTTPPTLPAGYLYIDLGGSLKRMPYYN